MTSSADRAGGRSRIGCAGCARSLGADVCVLNGENAADGVGITPKLAERLLAAGADLITLGNHVWRRPEIGPYLERSERVVRPANLTASAPGRGLAFAPAGTTAPSSP